MFTINFYFDINLIDFQNTLAGLCVGSDGGSKLSNEIYSIYVVYLLEYSRPTYRALTPKNTAPEVGDVFFHFSCRYIFLRFNIVKQLEVAFIFGE